MDRVAQLPCGVCGTEYGIELHHLLLGRGPGMRSPDMLVMPLCHDCHRGPWNGIHGNHRIWDVYKLNEHDVLADTLLKLYGRIK
jgi:hypothetical protein